MDLLQALFVDSFAHLRVLPGHPDAGVEAGSVVRLHDVPPEHAPRAHAAVVRTLGQSEVGILVT